MSQTTIDILILAFVGLLGIIGHSFKFIYDKNKDLKDTDPEYTFKMYLKKNKFIMYFVAICICVLSYYNNEWKEFESLGTWRGLIMFGMGYMGDSVFPSLLEVISIVSDKIKSAIGVPKP